MRMTVQEVGVAQRSAGIGTDNGVEPAATGTFDAWATAATPTLLRFARLVGTDAHTAADAVQDALLAVLLRWRRLSADAGQDAYARRVIVNRRISWWRRFGRRERLDAVPAEVTDPGPEPPELTADALVARRLLAELGDRQRAAVVLRYFDDLSFADIAAILDCPEATARSHVHRALARLRTLMEEESR